MKQCDTTADDQDTPRYWQKSRIDNGLGGL